MGPPRGPCAHNGADDGPIGGSNLYIPNLPVLP
eukprot:SAG11_NODE_18425_length_491_cov_1.951531_1_plen_32_part_01